MALKVKRIRRVAVAVVDIEGAAERYKQLFDIDPFDWGEVPELKYKWIAFRFGSEGASQCSMEFLSPMNDPDGEVLIGKFIRKRGEGLYMVTLEMEEDNKTFEAQLSGMGIKPSWGNAVFEDGPDYQTWTESYIAPRDAYGVLFTLAHIVPKLPRHDGEIPKFPK
ncbi:MAG: VOC family protein [Chloroflexota bacterium]